MTTARRLHHGYQEYLRLLEQSPVKLEFCQGLIHVMAGGTPAHAALGAAAIGLLRQALGKDCTVYASDLKVRIEASDLATFPDASAVCGPLATTVVDAQAVTNPSLLVEVTSPSTEEYDRGEKLTSYQRLPSLQAVLLVSHRRRAVTVVRRTPTGWEEREHGPGQRVALSSPPLQLEVDALYEGIALEP